MATTFLTHYQGVYRVAYDAKYLDILEKEAGKKDGQSALSPDDRMIRVLMFRSTEVGKRGKCGTVSLG